MRRLWGSLLASSIVIASLAAASAALADIPSTNSGDNLRTGWYPDAQISPEVVKGGTFGQLWSAPVTGQVYAQPLVASTPTTPSGKSARRGCRSPRWRRPGA